MLKSRESNNYEKNQTCTRRTTKISRKRNKLQFSSDRGKWVYNKCPRPTFKKSIKFTQIYFQISWLSPIKLSYVRRKTRETYGLSGSSSPHQSSASLEPPRLQEKWINSRSLITAIINQTPRRFSWGCKGKGQFWQLIFLLEERTEEKLSNFRGNGSLINNVTIHMP